jgi:hypothetical protein
MRLRRGRYIVRMTWFRIYWNGSYSKLEVDFGRPGHWELALYFGCNDHIITVRLNPSLKYLEYKIRLMTPNCL